MSNSIHLIGADDVRSAGFRMRDAAETMSQAVLNLDGSLERHQRVMMEFIERFEAAVDRMQGSGPDPYTQTDAPIGVTNG